MTFELLGAEKQVSLDGQMFSVDVIDADIVLAKIDAEFVNSAKTTESHEARWRRVAEYIDQLSGDTNGWRCKLSYAISFYKFIIKAAKEFVEDDAKAAFPFAESPTGTDSTPAASANGNSTPTSPTSTASTPSGS